MTVADLISQVLNVIGRQFYADSVREFKRDERALTQAIARYGYECSNRGWEFDVEFIKRELLDLLNNIKTRSADIRYLPIYLENAVDRSIRMRADKLVVEAKRQGIGSHQVKGMEVVSLANAKAGALVKSVMSEMKPTAAVVVKQSDTEVLATLYKDLKRQQRAKRKFKKVLKEKPQAVQKDLF